MAAFARAAALGVTEVETDVRKTADGRLVLWHDGRLRPKVDLDGRAEDWPLGTLESLSLAPWFEHTGAISLHPPGAGWTPVVAPCPEPANILGLDRYLLRFGQVFLHHIELKGEDADLPEMTLHALRSRSLRDRAVLTSFHFPHLESARALDAAIPLGFLCGRPGDDSAAVTATLDRCAGAGLQQICLHAALCTKAISGAAHSAGLELRAWGVSTRAEMLRVLEADADGMTINWPDELMAEFERREGGSGGDRTEDR
jgi:glycerophosphoryl diester phosphodiesterase